MKITINKRYKIILYMLLGIIVFFGYYQLVFRNQRNKISDLQNELSIYESKLNSYNTNKKYDKQLDSEIKIYATEINDKANDFFPMVIQEKIIIILDSMLSRSSLTCSGMSFAPSTVEELTLDEATIEEDIYILDNLVEEYNQLKRTEEIIDIPSDTEVEVLETETVDLNNLEVIFEIEKMNVSLQLSGTYSQLSSFITLVKEHEHKIVINNLTILAGEGDNLTADMNLDFYSVPKLIFEDGDYLKWNYNNTYGKENPFQ